MAAPGASAQPERRLGARTGPGFINVFQTLISSFWNMTMCQYFPCYVTDDCTRAGLMLLSLLIIHRCSRAS